MEWSDPTRECPLLCGSSRMESQRHHFPGMFLVQEERTAPVASPHLTLCPWAGKRKQSAEEASHQPEEMPPCSWGLTLSPQVLSEFLWVEMGPTITDSNWKSLTGLTRVSACLTDSRVASCQRTTRRPQIRGYLVTVRTFVRALSILQILLQSYHYVAESHIKLPLLTSLEMEFTTIES